MHAFLYRVTDYDNSTPSNVLHILTLFLLLNEKHTLSKFPLQETNAVLTLPSAC